MTTTIPTEVYILYALAKDATGIRRNKTVMGATHSPRGAKRWAKRWGYRSFEVVDIWLLRDIVAGTPAEQFWDRKRIHNAEYNRNRAEEAKQGGTTSARS